MWEVFWHEHYSTPGEWSSHLPARLGWSSRAGINLLSASLCTPPRNISRRGPAAADGQPVVVEADLRAGAKREILLCISLPLRLIGALPAATPNA